MLEYLKPHIRKVLAVPLGTLTHVHVQSDIAALTFDDGPNPESTPRVLSVLARHNAKATFFLVGKAIRSHPDIVAQIIKAGHEIGNHSFSHPDFTRLSARQRMREIKECDYALAPFSTNGRALFRPPMGFQTLPSRLSAFLARKTVVTWDVAPGDWKTHDAQRISTYLSERVSPGSIVLLHDSLLCAEGTSDGFDDRTPMLEALDKFLGNPSIDYRFLTVSELMRRGRPSYQWWSRS